ncbi:MAG: hypothetical protein IH866_03830 [Chloroflexi bacterium]|nr:hypothetical protein [Chloroflexota bacterium]
MTADLVSEIRAKLDDLREDLDKKRKERDNLLQKVAQDEALVKAYETVLSSETEDELSFLEAPPPMLHPSTQRLKIPEAVTSVLLSQDRAMHADEILQQVRLLGVALSAEDPKASVVTALVRGMKKGTFERVAPNTFRLVKEGG